MEALPIYRTDTHIVIIMVTQMGTVVRGYPGKEGLHHNPHHDNIQMREKVYREVDLHLVMLAAGEGLQSLV